MSCKNGFSHNKKLQFQKRKEKKKKKEKEKRKKDDGGARPFCVHNKRKRKRQSQDVVKETVRGNPRSTGDSEEPSMISACRTR